MKLFRDEVLAARRTGHLGAIRLAQPPSFVVTSLVALFLAGALIAFALSVEVTRKANVPGIVMPVLGSQQLTAAAPGVLLDVLVGEGLSVRRGQALFVLSVDRTTARGDVASLVTHSIQQRRVALESERAARQSLARERERGLVQRIQAIRAQLSQAQAEDELAARRVALAVKSSARYAQLAEQGFVAEIQSQQKQEELIEGRTRAAASRRLRLGLESQLLELQSEWETTSALLEAELSPVDRALAALDQEAAETEARRQNLIVAPDDGVVAGLTLARGAAVQAGQTLATLVPLKRDGTQSELEALLYAPSRTTGFVQAGQTVLLRYAAFPYQKFGFGQGQVASISRTPINPNDLPAGQAQALMSAAQSNEPLYRINVRLQAQTINVYGEEQVLKPGMALEASILQDRRLVWEWLLEPLIAVRSQSKTLEAIQATSRM